MLPDFDDSLKWFLEEDAKVFGALPVCQKITILSEELTWKHLVESGTLRQIEILERRVAERIVEEEIPIWIPKKWNIAVCTRASSSLNKYPAYVVTSAYFCFEEDE